MAIKVKSADTVAAKWAANAQNAGQAYIDGVNNPKRPQAESAIAAAPTWAAGVQAAVTNGSYVKGLTVAGNAKWRDNSVSKGGQRYGPGVAGSTPAMAKGIAPFLQAISQIDLQPRQVKGSPANYQRVAQIGNALRAVKAGQA